VLLCLSCVGLSAGVGDDIGVGVGVGVGVDVGGDALGDFVSWCVGVGDRVVVAWSNVMYISKLC
jgi:hypothetical protein